MNTHQQFHPRRELGRTGFIATALGIGDLADRSLPLDTCVATARRALEAGLNLIDTAPGYEDGYSEQIVGMAVKDLRDQVFVVNKIESLIGITKYTPPQHTSGGTAPSRHSPPLSSLSGSALRPVAA